MDLPNVGDRLIKLMSIGNLAPTELFTPEECEVTYVNSDRNWYEVRFLKSGIRECYNLPDFNHSILQNVLVWATPVVCVETGYVYRSIDDCAKDMGLFAGNISRCLSGKRDSYRGYHFDTVL